MIKIIIADDHPAVRNAWNIFLSAHKNIQVLAECGNGRDAINKAAELSPDIILMDINMTDMSGIEATREIVAHFPPVKVHTAPVYVERMIGAGARGYVFKHVVADQLVKAIYEVYSGEIYIATENVTLK